MKASAARLMRSVAQGWQAVLPAAESYAGERGRVPVVLQSAPAECGVAALEMVLRYHGMPEDRRALRRALGYPLGGSTIGALREAAHACGLDAEGFDASVDDLARVPMPAILHLTRGHFVVLEGRRGDAFAVVDPAVGRREMDRAALEREFSGAVLALEPAARAPAPRPAGARVGADPSTLRARRVLLGAGPVRMLVAALALQGALLAIAVGAVGWALAPSLRGELADGARIAAALGALALLLACRAWVGTIDAAVTRHAGERVMARFTDGVQRAAPAYVESRAPRYLANLAGDLDPAVNQGVPAPRHLLGLVPLGTALAVAAMRAPVAALVVALVAAMEVAYATLRDAHVERRATGARAMTREARKLSVMLLTGIRQLASVGSLGTIAAHWSERRTAAQHAYGDAAALAPPARPASSVVACGVACAVLLMLHVRGRLSLEATLAAMLLAGSVVALAATMHVAWQRARRWEVALGRLRELLEEGIADAAPAAMPGAPGMHAPAGARPYALECVDVTYRAPDDGPLVLDRFALQLRAGEMVAVVGGPGAGKTVLARLLLGHERPRHGSVRVDGVEVAMLAPDVRGTLVGGLLEGAEPLDGTVLEHLMLGSERVDAEAMRQALRRAGLEEWVASLPLGRQTPIGRGGQFSERRRRRLCLAQLLVRPPAVMVLDATLDAMEGAEARTLAAMLSTLPVAVVLLTARRDVLPPGCRVVELPAPAGRA